MLEIKTMSKEIKISIEKDEFLVHVNSQLLCNLPAGFIFDLLKSNLSTKSPDISVRRRALQLSGLSLKQAIKLCSRPI